MSRHHSRESAPLSSRVEHHHNTINLLDWVISRISTRTGYYSRDFYTYQREIRAPEDWTGLELHRDDGHIVPVLGSPSTFCRRDNETASFQGRCWCIVLISCTIRVSVTTRTFTSFATPPRVTQIPERRCMGKCGRREEERVTSSRVGGVARLPERVK